MPNNSPEDLFQLIKSLNQSEKGYFKKFVSTHAKGEIIYLRLFDAIEKQKEYDEKMLRQKSGITQPELLKRTKHYLYHLILKSLDLYHADHSVDDTIRKYMKHSELLYNKGLHEQSYTMLRKSKAMAYRYEKHLLLPAILHLELRIAFQLKDPSMLKNCIKEISVETPVIFGKSKDIIDYVVLNLQLTLLQREEGLDYTRGKGQKELREIIQSPLMENEKRASSFISKNVFYNISATYNLIVQKPSLSLLYEQKKIKLMESHPHQIKDFVYAYFATVSNLHNTQCRLKKYADAEETLEKLRTIPEKFSFGKKAIYQIEIFSFYLTNATDLYNKTGRFEKSLQLVPALEKGLIEYKGKMRKENLIFLYFNTAVAYFGLQQFKQALLWLNKILNFPEQEIMQLIHSMSKILNLLIQYELKRDDYLEYVSRSSRRYLEKHQQLFEVEKTMLHFMEKKLPLAEEKEDLKKVFKELKTKLQALAKDPRENILLEELDLISWAESKIANRSFAEVAKEKTMLRK